MDLDDIPTLDLDTLDDDLVKGIARGGKYYRRVPTGNPKRPWRYYYTKEEYDREHGEAAHVNGREIAQHREREKSGEVKLTKKELLHKLKHGTFSIISAGRNPNHPDEGHLDVNDPKFEARHEELRRELQKRGMKYTEVIGHYGGKEKSFLVYHHDEAKPEKQVGERAMMVHHDSPSQFGVIRELGKKFNQDSVIHSHGGKHEMHFTTGPNAGKHLKGDGHEIKPHAEDFYTHTPTKRGATKFALNFDWDNYHAYESAMHKSQRFIVSGDRFFKAWQPWHRYISKKPDGHGGWIYIYDRKAVQREKDAAALAGDNERQREVREHENQAKQHLHEVGSKALAKFKTALSKNDFSTLTPADWHHAEDHAERTGDPFHGAVKGLRSVHDKKLKKAYAGHKYISKKRGPDGKWVYTYQRPDGGQYGSPHAPTTWQMRTSDEGRKVSRIKGADLLEQAKMVMRTKNWKRANALSASILNMLSFGARDGVVNDEKSLRQAWRRLNPGSTKKDLNDAIDRTRFERERHKRMSESTQKSMAQHAPEESIMEEIMESTPELREQIKMVIAQEDPMAKGLYAFEPGYGKQGVNKIPDDYLAAYLDAFIEEAFEHEKRERCHDENAAIMGISQPNGANGGIGGDEADWWAQWVMNELVIYCGKNENIMRACTKLNATKDFVASRLRAMGLVKPSFNGGTINGDFMEGYQFSEEQTAAGIGKSLTADAGAFPSTEEMIKSVQRTNGVLADGGEMVRLDDDGVNPVEMLANVHRTRFALMQDVFGLDLGINTKR